MLEALETAGREHPALLAELRRAVEQLEIAVDLLAAQAQVELISPINKDTK
jgi:hypothetical protein